MPAAFDTVALIGKYQSEEVTETLRELAEFLRARGCKVMVEQGTASATNASDYVVAPYEVIGAQADLVVILGGDGTMLNTARRLAEFDVPLVGVNQGRLGFLTDIARRSVLDRMASLLDGRYSSERRSLLDAEVIRSGERVFQTLAFNDVVVNKGELGRMIEFEVRIDGDFVYSQRSDGLIISTPTGSTAYALSANGPILHPSVAGVTLVPLCPHALSNRPITVSDESVIEVLLMPPHDARVHSDGQSRFDARANDTVRIVRAAHAVRLLHPEGYNYYAMLREKLHWSESPRDGR